MERKIYSEDSLIKYLHNEKGVAHSVVIVKRLGWFIKLLWETEARRRQTSTEADRGGVKEGLRGGREGPISIKACPNVPTEVASNETRQALSARAF